MGGEGEKGRRCAGTGETLRAPSPRPPVFAGDRGVKGGWWLQDTCKCGHLGHAHADMDGSQCGVAGCKCKMFRERLTGKRERA